MWSFWIVSSSHNSIKVLARVLLANMLLEIIKVFNDLVCLFSSVKFHVCCLSFNRFC